MGHHYVPQKYLRGFANPDTPDFLWQFDKQTQKFTDGPASIKKIAQQRAFYDEDTERLLNEDVERPGNAVLNQLRSGNFNLTHSDRTSLAVYIATMTHRVPNHRATADEMAPKVLANVTDRLRNTIRAHADAGRISTEVAERRLAETDDAETKFSEQMPPDVMADMYSPWPTERIVDAIYGMHWRFALATGGQQFVTTDNPAFFFTYDGLGSEESELTFPVSSDLAIFGSWRPLNGDPFIRLTKFVKEANRRLISDATRFVYHRSRPSWISVVAAKEQPYLSRIRW